MKRYLLFCWMGLIACGSFAQELRLLPLGKPGFRVFLLQEGGHQVLLDAGAPGHAPRIMRQLRRQGIGPGQLDCLILSHGHGDHAGGAAAFQREWQTPVWIGAGDESFALGENGEIRIVSPREGLARMVLKHTPQQFPPFAPDRVIGDADSLALRALGISATLQRVGGHTAGSLVLLLDDGRALTGDLIRGAVMPGFRRGPRIHFFAEDQAQVWRQLARLRAGGVHTLYPAHFGPLKMKRLSRKYGKFLKG
jgi:glyoxylase-like metal-dependent hydrolase (beta-lactamase superfamily II)